ALALGRLDHREPDAVLDRAARVVALELEEELARSRLESRHLHERRVADEGEDVLHSGSSRKGMPEISILRMENPWRAARSSIASETLCGSSVGPMVTREMTSEWFFEPCVSFTTYLTDAWLPFSTAIISASSSASDFDTSRHSRSSPKRWSLMTGATCRKSARNCARRSSRFAAVCGLRARNDLSSTATRSAAMRSCSFW